MSEKPTEPKMKAGEAEIDMCPFCKVKFNQKCETNVELTCPNPQCQRKFTIMVLE